ncbi:MAG: hypothetical protein JST89_01350 [Cyanobacteria bacterium SZAS-4]|nr:hypothetical protein [Cyanobacteria bacterium SZAS-4]
MTAVTTKFPSVRARTSDTLRCVTIIALLIFVALNFLIEQTHARVHGEKDLSLFEENRVINLVSICSKTQNYPDLMLLGSSVMGLPFADLTDSRDFRPFYFVNQFNALLGITHFVAINLGTDSAMISDSSLLLQKCVTDKQTPRFIVLGLTPRDFGAEGRRLQDSYHFSTLVQLGDFMDIQGLYLPSLEEKVNFLLEKLVPIFRYRGYVQHKVVQFSNKFWHGESAKPIDEPEQIKPMSGKQRGIDTWDSMVEQYRKIYAKLRPELIKTQMEFLARFVQKRQTAQTRVLVINMPLSSDNRALLPDSFYEKFRKDVADTVTNNGGVFLDLGSSSEFEHRDFFDCAHLNAQGCRKLMVHIVDFIKNKNAADR